MRQYDRRLSTRRSCIVLPAMLALVAIGCSSKPELMPTPNVYATSNENPFADIPPALQSNKLEVLYLTDRQPINDTPDNREYGHKRSRSVAFGVCEVEFGKDVPWDQLVAASRSAKRSIKLPVSINQTKELLVFPATPQILRTRPSPIPGAPDEQFDPMAETEACVKQAAAELTARLEKSPDKEVYLFVHGVANQFSDSINMIAQIWHFLGRRGVPVAYSWPAGGGGGPLRAYTYDRESSEFTIFHIKQAIRAIVACPEVKKLHIIGHSRGCDVVVSALHELQLQIDASGRSTRAELKLGTVVLAAPDVDMDVVLQKAATSRLGLVPEQSAVYLCSRDEALGIANWLFGGVVRMGKITPEVFTEAEMTMLREAGNPQLIDARISNAGAFGHNYFHSNPSVSSDLMLLLRYHLRPGAEHGRPLGREGGGFWVIKDGYPNGAPLPATDAPSP